MHIYGNVWHIILTLQDFHSHLNVKEVLGYLGGKFNQTSRSRFTLCYTTFSTWQDC